MPTGRTRLAAAAGLLVLSPICAEYLIGYAPSIGRPLDLAAGLLFLAPLYGAVALGIREATRRTGRGPLALLTLAAAAGLLQAGLVDQSLFNPHLTDDPTYDDERGPTLIAGTGLSARYLLNFITGHVIWSYTAPIVIIETAAPRIADRPWLHRRGLLTLTVCYLAIAALIHHDNTRDFHASPTQLTTTALAVLTLTGAALIPRRRHPPAKTPHPPHSPHPTNPHTGGPTRRTRPGRGRPPAPWMIATGTLIGLTAHQLLPPTWPGVTADAAILGGALAVLLTWYGRWDRRHALAAAGAALIVNAGLSFAVIPIGGDVSYPAKYAANATLTLGVLLLLAWTHRRHTRHQPRTRADA